MLHAKFECSLLDCEVLDHLPDHSMRLLSGLEPHPTELSVFVSPILELTVVKVIQRQIGLDDLPERIQELDRESTNASPEVKAVDIGVLRLPLQQFSDLH